MHPRGVTTPWNGPSWLFELGRKSSLAGSVRYRRRTSAIGVAGDRSFPEALGPHRAQILDRRLSVDHHSKEHSGNTR
jgi:hypothetical protein